MSWDCCNPRGECRMGPGCPAGVLLDQPQRTSAKTTPTPAARTGTPTHVDLRRVQLFAPAKHKADRSVLFAVLAASFKGCVMAFAVVGVLSTCVPATSADTPAPVFSKPAKVTT
jgi:hypothetical protein